MQSTSAHYRSALDAIGAALADCPLGLEHASLDCTGLPCLLVATDGDDAGVLRECLGVEAEEGDPDRLAASIMDGLSLGEVHQLGASIAERVAANHGPGDVPSLEHRLAGCGEAAPIRDCQEMMQRGGCAPSSLALDPSAYQEVLDLSYDAVEDLEARCPSFADIGKFVDCSRVPCVVGVPHEDLEGASLAEVACFDSILDGARMLTLEGGMAMLPLVNLPVAEERRENLRERWAEQKDLRYYEIGHFGGFE